MDDVREISEENQRREIALAWRPAWSIRNRKGTIQLIVDWWRRLRGS